MKHPRLIIHLAFALILFTGPVVYGQFEPLTDKIIEYNNNRPEEILFAHLDREVYYPGDTLWFKVYLRNRASLREQTLSRSVFVRLVDESGKAVHESKHLVFNSECKGQFELSNQIAEGNYRFVCYSSLMKNNPVEEVFRKALIIRQDVSGKPKFSVRFDKPYYFPGDTIRTEIQLLDQHKTPVPDNRFRYKWLNGKKSILSGRWSGSIGRRTRSLQSGSGSTEYGSGSIADEFVLPLPPDPAGDYFLELSATYQGIIIDTLFTLPVVDSVYVGFYPEGGNFVAGLENRMAFLATTRSGLPLDISGTVYRDNGLKVVSVKSELEGMGCFNITPEPGAAYYMVIEDPGDIRQLVPLPPSVTDGWMLKAGFRDQAIEVSFGNPADTISPVLITVLIRGHMTNYISLTSKGYGTGSIPVGDLPMGIAVVTLFDRELNPRAERLVFIHPERLQQVKLESDHSGYLPRDSAKIRIRVTGPDGQPARGSFSLSVVDKQLCESPLINEPNIISSLLLKPEIKGQLLQSDTYFNQKNGMRGKNLDLLLMTHGWRKYRYSRIWEADPASIGEFMVPDLISGQIKRIRYARSSVPEKGYVRLYNAGITQLYETEEDGSFEFLFEHEPGLDPNLVLYGENLNGKQNMEIFLSEDHFDDSLLLYLEETPPAPILLQYASGDEGASFTDQRTLSLNNHWIEEVTIISKRRMDFIETEELLFNAKKIEMEEMSRPLNPYEILLERGEPVNLDMTQDGYEFVTYRYRGGQVLWRMDNMDLPYQDIKNTLSEDIESFYIVRFPDTQVYGPWMDPESVIVAIHTKPSSERESIYLNRRMVKLDPVTLSKEFFKPLYDSDMKRYSSVPDLRKTIHWEPDITLDENGEATVSFYNGDRYTQISCILEGITDQGIPVSGKTGYRIQTLRESD